MSLRLKSNHEMDLTKGPILKNLLIYALPLIGVNVLQLLFNTADVMVLGIFTNDAAVAAVGATASITNLIIGLFVGLSLGTNVLIARCVGENNIDRSRRIVGTSLVVSVIFGFVISIVGVLGAKQFLIWMKCDSNVLDLATKYLRIYFLGMPIVMLYNFSAAILRAIGDTFRPFIYLVIGGIVNIILNIFFVVVLNFTVEGVAIATVASQAVSVLFACVALKKDKGFAKVERKHLRIYKKELIDIFIIGAPIGLSKCLFSLSNVFIQTEINSFGEKFMAAHAIGHQIDAFINEAATGISLASLSFISQNLGAKNMQRIKKTIYSVLILTFLTVLLLDAIILPLAPYLSDIMTDDADIIHYACERIYIIGGTFIICSISTCFQEALRGLGKSFTAMVVNVIATCVFRILWMKLLFPLAPTHAMIYLAYPTSWFLASVLCLILIVPTFKKLKSTFSKQENIVESSSDVL